MIIMKTLNSNRLFFYLVTCISLCVFTMSCTSEDSSEDEFYDEISHDWSRNERE